MMRVRLKADGRIVEILPDGSEKTVDHSDPAAFVRQVRARCGLTQASFAEKIEVPIETVRNWEQGKRSPRGPARALLKLIDSAPDAAFAALGGKTALTRLFGETARYSRRHRAAGGARSASAGTSRSTWRYRR